MAAPTIQNLDEILAAIQPGYQQQEALAQQQIQNIGQQTQGAKAGLEVAKGNAFRDINRSTNARGLAFSGVPIEEQTRYVGEKFLPAVAALESGAQDKQFSLQQLLANIGTEKRNFAVQTQEGQKKSLAEYQQAEADRIAKIQSAEADRQIEREKIAISSRSGGKTPTQGQMKQADAAALAQAISTKVGRDGYVSPDTYLQAKQAWVNNGYSSQEFDNYFSNFRNPKNRYYKVG